MTTTLIIPGLRSSGPDHWQTWFEERIPGTVRVVQSDWNKPDLEAWSHRIRREILRHPGRLLIAAHSFGVLAAVHAAADLQDRISGALFVAPADPDGFMVSDLLPQTPLAYPSVLVASATDPWMLLKRATNWADWWDSDLVNLGDAGHINAESGFGPWPEGLALLERLRRRAAVLASVPVDVEAGSRSTTSRSTPPPRISPAIVPRSVGLRRVPRRVPSLGVG